MKYNKKKKNIRNKILTQFRQGLVQGEVEIIHPILTWLLTHIDVVQKRAYLSRFLIKVRF